MIREKSQTLQKHLTLPANGVIQISQEMTEVKISNCLSSEDDTKITIERIGNKSLFWEYVINVLGYNLHVIICALLKFGV